MTNHSHTLQHLFFPAIFLERSVCQTLWVEPTVAFGPSSGPNECDMEGSGREEEMEHQEKKKSLKTKSNSDLILPRPHAHFFKNFSFSLPPRSLTRLLLLSAHSAASFPPPPLSSLPFRFLLSVSFSPSMSRQAETGRLLLCLQSDTISS